MNETQFNHLLEESWRRTLTPAEEAELQAHLATRPQAQADWELDLSLTHALSQLPDAPLSSNFTARVLQAVEREAGVSTPGTRFLEWARRQAGRLTPRVAWAGLVAATALVGAYQWRLIQREHELAQSLAVLSKAMPEPKVLQDFDAIQQLSQLAPVVDEELWLALNSVQE
jgi:anti-sigma factor RsiW